VTVTTTKDGINPSISINDGSIYTVAFTDAKSQVYDDTGTERCGAITYLLCNTNDCANGMITWATITNASGTYTMKISPILYSTAADKPVSGANTLYFRSKLSDAAFGTATTNIQTITVTVSALTTA